ACGAGALILYLFGPLGSRWETGGVRWGKRRLSAGITRCSPRQGCPSLGADGPREAVVLGAAASAGVSARLSSARGGRGRGLGEFCPHGQRRRQRRTSTNGGDSGPTRG